MKAFYQEKARDCEIFANLCLKLYLSSTIITSKMSPFLIQVYSGSGLESTWHWRMTLSPSWPVTSCTPASSSSRGASGNRSHCEEHGVSISGWCYLLVSSTIQHDSSLSFSLSRQIMKRLFVHSSLGVVNFLSQKVISS